MPSSGSDQGFRPWHFFVLASLAASTVAVMHVAAIRARASHPDQSDHWGGGIAAAAAVYRMLAAADRSRRRRSLPSVRPNARARRSSARRRWSLRSIKELEFDRAMGKVSAKDFDEMGGRLRARAMNLMKQLDAGGSGYREAIERELNERLRRPDSPDLASAGSAQARDAGGRPAVKDAVARPCISCETTNDPDAIFCKRCGTALATVQ